MLAVCEFIPTVSSGSSMVFILVSWRNTRSCDSKKMKFSPYLAQFIINIITINIILFTFFNDACKCQCQMSNDVIREPCDINDAIITQIGNGVLSWFGQVERDERRIMNISFNGYVRRKKLKIFLTQFTMS